MIKFNHPKHPAIGHWNLLFWLGRPLAWRLEVGWHLLEVGFFKLKSEPPHGAPYTRGDYRGFWIRLFIWLPVDVHRDRKS